MGIYLPRFEFRNFFYSRFVVVKLIIKEFLYGSSVKNIFL